MVIFRDCTEFLIDSDNNIRIVLMIVEFVEYIEFKGVLRRSSWEEFATVAKELSLHSKFCFHWINLLRDILVRVCLSSEIMIIHTQLIMRVTWKISSFSLNFPSNWMATMLFNVCNAMKIENWVLWFSSSESKRSIALFLRCVLILAWCLCEYSPKRLFFAFLLNFSCSF